MPKIGDTKNGYKVIGTSHGPEGRRGKHWLAMCNSCEGLRSISTSLWNQGRFRCRCHTDYGQPRDRRTRKSVLTFTIRGITWPIDEWVQKYNLSITSIYSRNNRRTRFGLDLSDEWVVFGRAGMPVFEVRETAEATLLRSLVTEAESIIAEKLTIHLQNAAKEIMKSTLDHFIIPYLATLRAGQPPQNFTEHTEDLSALASKIQPVDLTDEEIEAERLSLLAEEP